MLLDVSGRMVVPVVESDLSDGDDAGMGGESLHGIEVRRGEQARFVGMDSDGGVNPGIALGEGNGTGDIVRAVSVADGEKSTDACVIGALDGGVKIRGELRAVEVGVGV